MNIKNVAIANELLQNIKESYIENNEKHFSEKKEQVVGVTTPRTTPFRRIYPVTRTHTRISRRIS